mgnify:CR=1 FL=1
MASPQDDYKPRDVIAGYKWLKFRTNLLDNPRFGRLTDLAKALYFEVYLLAGKSDAGGLVLAGDEPASADEVAYILRRPVDAVQAGLTELQASGFVELDAGTVTVCRFASEQGPAQKELRKEWVKRQAKRRALARGEVWQEPDADTGPDTDRGPDQDQDTDQDQNSDADKDLKTEPDLKIKSKRVTDTSQESHESVTRDTKNGGGGGFEQQILDSWTELTGLEFKSNQKFVTMVADWQTVGVTLQDVRQAITETLGVANTPLYLDVLVQNLHRRNKLAGGADVDKYRALAQKYNQTNRGYKNRRGKPNMDGYEVSHASEIVINDDGSEVDDGKPIKF